MLSNAILITTKEQKKNETGRIRRKNDKVIK